ncbi:MAG: methyltransferase domain-containing protein [Chthoniobacterales bacterium]
MSESIKIDADVHELMERIRRQTQEGGSDGRLALTDSSLLLSPRAALPPVPSARHLVPKPPRIEKLQQLLEHARQKTEFSSAIPKFLHRLLRKQGGFNRLLLESAMLLTKTAVQLHKQLSGVSAHLEAQTRWLESFVRARAQDQEWMTAAGLRMGELPRLNERVERLAERMDAIAEHIEQRVRSVQTAHATELQQVSGRIDSAAEHVEQRVRSLQASQARDLQQLHAAHTRELEEMQAARTAELQQVSERIDFVAQDIEQRIRSVEASQASELQQVKASHGSDLQQVQASQAKELQQVQAAQAKELQRVQAAHAKELQQMSKRIDALARRLERADDLVQSKVEKRLDVVGEDLAGIARDLADAGAHLRRLQAHSDVTDVATKRGLGQLEREIIHLRRDADALRVASNRVDERQLADSSYFKAQFSAFTQLLQAEIDGARGPKGRGRAAKPKARLLESRTADTFYLAFENAFRGDRADVKRRQKVYISHLSSLKVPRSKMRVLDLGCGRGEWLEVLAEKKFKARGVDLSATMVDFCKTRGFDAAREDAIAYLKKQADESFTAVTAFHLIEHLPFPSLMELLREALRVLQPRGLLICETPNPANIQVGAHFFYRDPTHQRPLPPDSTRFLALHVGFRLAEILPVNPCTADARLPADDLEVTERFNEFFYGPQDYAILGRK